MRHATLSASRGFEMKNGADIDVGCSIRVVEDTGAGRTEWASAGWPEWTMDGADADERTIESHIGADAMTALEAEAWAEPPDLGPEQEDLL